MEDKTNGIDTGTGPDLIDEKLFDVYSKMEVYDNELDSIKKNIEEGFIKHKNEINKNNKIFLEKENELSKLITEKFQEFFDKINSLDENMKIIEDKNGEIENYVNDKMMEIDNKTNICFNELIKKINKKSYNINEDDIKLRFNGIINKMVEDNLNSEKNVQIIINEKINEYKKGFNEQINEKLKAFDEKLLGLSNKINDKTIDKDDKNNNKYEEKLKELEEKMEDLEKIINKLKNENNKDNKDNNKIKDDKNIPVKQAKIKNREKSDNILDSGNNFIKNNHDENILTQNKLTKGSNNDKKSINIQRIQIFVDKDTRIIQNKMNLKKVKDQNLAQNLSQRKFLYKSISKLTKNEKETLNSIKKVMKNYYLQYAYNEFQSPPQLTLKNSSNYNDIFTNKNYYGNRIPYKTNYQYNNDIFKNSKSNNIERGQMITTPKYDILTNTMTDRSKFKGKNNNKYENKSVFKNQRLIKTIKYNLNLDSIDDRFELFNYENNNYYINKRNQFSKRLQIEAENKNNSFINENNNKHFHNIRINNINDNKTNNKNEFNGKKHLKDENNIIIEENIKIKKNKVPLKSLIDKYMSDLKMITDPDFDIFDFQKKVSYINVLPIMGYIILKCLGLIDRKIISTKKLESFLYTVSRNYKQTTLYHNGLHGADVAQSLCIYILNSNAEEICETSVLDLLGLIVSAMGHDLGHPGLNNNFHINAGTDLGITYNDASCLENYHSSYLFRILRKEENNIIEKFSVNNYKNIRKRMISQILATDMANHGENISLIRTKINTWKEEGLERFNLLSGNDKTKFEEQQILLNYLIHMADLGHNCKKYEISIQWVKLLTEEFWRQGDLEKEKGLPISFLCDRDKIDRKSVV